MIKLRGSRYSLIRRVPKRYASVESRREIVVALHTDSESEAKRKADAVWQEMLAGWEAQLGSSFEQAELRFNRARAAARGAGYSYMRAADVAALPLQELLERIQGVGKDVGMADALLGLAPPPTVTVSAALDLFWPLAEDKTVGKTPDQLRRWRNPRIKAVREFIDVVGDMDIAKINGDDMLVYRDFFMQRVRAGEITAGSANKSITYLGGVLRTVNKLKRLGLNLPLDDLMLAGDHAESRDPYSTEFIRDKLLAPGALAGLNREARLILLMLINTGARPSEIAGLLPHHFLLSGEIPMINIKPEGRQLKNAHSERRIPLAGVSLEAARDAAATGFPAYAGRDLVSATINKFLKTNGLKETPKTTLYSLRHSWEDRALEAGIDQRVRSDIFGHSIQRQRYGVGGGDALRYEAIKKVAL